MLFRSESSWPERGLGDAGCGHDAHTRLGTRLASRPLRRPPPGGCGPQRAQNLRRSQKTQGHGPQLGRPLRAALTSAPASSPSAPRGCRSNQQAAPWGRGSRTSVHSPCVRTQPRLPWRPGLRSRAAGKVRRCGEFGVSKKRLLTDPSKSETWLHQRIFFKKYLIAVVEFLLLIN